MQGEHICVAFVCPSALIRQPVRRRQRFPDPVVPPYRSTEVVPVNTTVGHSFDRLAAHWPLHNWFPVDHYNGSSVLCYTDQHLYEDSRVVPHRIISLEETWTDLLARSHFHIDTLGRRCIDIELVRFAIPSAFASSVVIKRLSKRGQTSLDRAIRRLN